MDWPSHLVRSSVKLINAYADGDLLEAGQLGDADLKDNGGEPTSENKARNASSNKNKLFNTYLLGGVEREEQVLVLELVHLKSILEFSKVGQTTSVSA